MGSSMSGPSGALYGHAAPLSIETLSLHDHYDHGAYHLSGSRALYRTEYSVACVGWSVYMVGLFFALYLVFLELKRFYQDGLVSG